MSNKKERKEKKPKRLSAADLSGLTSSISSKLNKWFQGNGTPIPNSMFCILFQIFSWIKVQVQCYGRVVCPIMCKLHAVVHNFFLNTAQSFYTVKTNFWWFNFIKCLSEPCQLADMHKTETLELSSLNGMKSFIMCCAQQHFEPRMLRAFSVNTVLSFIINVQVKLIISFSVALCRAQGCVRPRQLHTDGPFMWYPCIPLCFKCI